MTFMRDKEPSGRWRDIDIYKGELDGVLGWAFILPEDRKWTFELHLMEAIASIEFDWRRRTDHLVSEKEAKKDVEEKEYGRYWI